MKENTVAQIRNRMIKNAAQMWDIPANEIETSFDPIVNLLISACASEIAKITGEVDESQTRITEKVIQLMTPETMNGPSLAHGILYAETVDEKTLIKPEYLFNHRKKEAYKKTSLKYKDIYFSPVQDFNLVNAKVQYLATGNTFIELEEKKSKHLEAKNLKNSQLPPSTLYIGISSDLKTIPVKDISFYFELLGVADKELFYHHLRNARWFVNDTELEINTGFYNDNMGQSSNIESIFESVSDKTNTTCQQIISRYRKHYITLKSTAQSKGIKKSDFSELGSLFEDNKIKIDSNIRWLKIVFPKIISNTILKNTFCSLNAFPVLNRELNNFSYQLKEFIHIIPIKTEDLFYDIKAIVNTDGKNYRARNKDNSNVEKGTFVLRNDNVGKLDKRKAREYLVYLIELLKDESASFSFLNNDFLRSNLNGLNQLIALLEKKVSEASNEVTQTNYVVLKPFKTNDVLLVEYWTTNGHAANNIKSGSELSIYKGVGVKQGKSYLLTTTHGGKDDLTMEDRLNSYRRSLLSRDRIVTKEDVKALCYELYGNKITKVEIKKGYTKAIDLKKGLVQCIEIVLSPNNENIIEVQEWESLSRNLLNFLEKNSINVFPYKIKMLN